jgi:hypothetical protein
MGAISVGRSFRTFGLAMAAAASLLLAACATAPVIHTRMAVGANLSQAHTYAFVRHPGTDHGPYKSLTTQHLERFVMQQMQARGYTLVAADAEPDLLVDFRLRTRDRVEGDMGPAFMGGYWGGWGPYGGGPWGGPYGWGWGGYYNDVRTVTSAALTISVIDRSTRSVIWSGTASSDVSHHQLYHPGKSLAEAVQQIFLHYPVPPSTH